MLPVTNRLTLRPMTQDDWLDRQLANYARDGYGLWAVCLDGSMIGQCGITWQNIDGEHHPEIGYHIKRAH